MKIFILINAILEIGAGLALFFIPQMAPELANENQPTGEAFAMMYGAAALSVGFLALKTWKNFEDVSLRKVFFFTFSIFHSLVAIAAFRGTMTEGFDNPGIGILHTIMVLATIYFSRK